MGQGLSVFNLAGAAEDPADLDTALGAVSSFFANVTTACPTGTTVQVSNVVEVRNEGTGALIATVSGAGQTPAPGSGSGVWAAGVGARVRWTTGVLTRTRPAVGTTFIVPLAASAFESNGTLASSFITMLGSAASGMLGALNSAGLPLGVWARPSTTGGSDGALNPVTGYVVPDQASWLTSRRH